MRLASLATAVPIFKCFRKLVDLWADAALQLTQLKTRLGLHSGES